MSPNDAVLTLIADLMMRKLALEQQLDVAAQQAVEREERIGALEAQLAQEPTA